jgi:hypothetical protein
MSLTADSCGGKRKAGNVNVGGDNKTGLTKAV